jgi:hypothetical protein
MEQICSIRNSSMGPPRWATRHPSAEQALTAKEMDKFQSVAGELYRTVGVTLAVTRPRPGS